MNQSFETPAFCGRDILSVDELSREEMLFVADTTRRLDDHRRQITERLAGKCMYYAFFEPSTRTRFSFVYAARALSLQTIGFSSTSATSTSKGEPLKDTLMMVQGYGADVIVLRHPLAGAAVWGADTLQVPVLNAGDGAHEHPTQTLLDLYSILKLRKPSEPWRGLRSFDNLTVSFVGDLKYGRTVHSLTSALARFKGVRLNFVAPDVLQMPDHHLEILRDRGVPYDQFERMQSVLPETDILYMTRIQRERFRDEGEYERVKRVFHLSADDLRDARPGLRVMHPLPRDKKNLELDFSVDATPHAYYYQQAEHGLEVRQALLALVTGGIDTPRHDRPSLDDGAQAKGLSPRAPGTRHTGKPRPKYLFTIDEGTVIDHILPGRSGLVRRALHIPEKVPVLVAENLESYKMPDQRKDLVKFIGYKPSQAELNQAALISPEATISFISHGRITEKGAVVLPDLVRGVIECQNPNCISWPDHLEGVTPVFRTVSRQPPVLQCYYCDHRVRHEEIAFVGQS